ncbi:tRNA pseudouridine(55) synthase TruB [Candidatus Uhrbacteria bacterium]|nr:tRNA pseudouridine(55) synthase TruB [Candidatus Uhrbacteria bacterium]
MPTILAIWKPKGPTSHDVVDAVRRITGERRVGHAGTLDPAAEGVLVIGIGREATKHLANEVAKEKEYVATIRLGAESTTDDSEGEITPPPSHSPSHREGEKVGVGRSAIERVLPHFVGHISQVPPAYSAVKLKGTPAYKLARRGRVPELKPRTVEIKEIELLESNGALLTLRVVCGPGTYIRSLARDIGHALGVGGYLTNLTRTRVGTYTKATALTLEEFRDRWPNIASGH